MWSERRNRADTAHAGKPRKDPFLCADPLADIGKGRRSGPAVEAGDGRGHLLLQPARVSRPANSA